MNIWGMIIGGAAGFAIGGPIGALLGVAAGHYAEAKLKGPRDPFEAKKNSFYGSYYCTFSKNGKGRWNNNTF